MEFKKCFTESTRIFIAGNIDIAKQYCREYFYDNPGCVTITPTTYIYTGGEEEGVIIEFINYARFPYDKTPKDHIMEFTITLAKKLCQKSCSIQFSDETHYLEFKNKT